jgi:hypothetical protein
MTKRKDSTPTPASMLNALRTMVVAPEATNETRLRSLELAYEIGKSEGHFAGAVKMAEGLTADFSKSLDRIAAKATP